MTHGELREKFGAVSREEVFEVRVKALLLLRGFYFIEVMIEQCDSIRRTRRALPTCLTQTVETLQLITSCRTRMEDLVANDPAYSIEELQLTREDIISIRAAVHPELTAQKSQGELDAGDVPSSNERGDVSISDMSGPWPS